MMSNLLAAPKRLSLWALIFVIAVMLSACGEAGHEEGAANAQPVTLSREIPDADQRRGRELIAQYGCGSCHKIPGIAKADGNVGPPLNDWADRQYIAGSLPNTPDNLIYWIRFPQAVEPGTVMPNMDLSPEDARDMAAFLYTLQDAGQISDIFATPRAWVQGAIAPEDDQVPVTGEEGGQEGGQVGGEDQHAEGLAVYNSTCTFCHQADGRGVEGSFPPLAGSDFVTQEDPTGVIQTVLHGRGQMPSFGDRLSDEEIAAVVSYIRSAWGNQAAAISAEQVNEQRQGQE